MAFPFESKSTEIGIEERRVLRRRGVLEMAAEFCQVRNLGGLRVLTAG